MEIEQLLLQVMDAKSKRPISKSRRKTCIVGFIATIRSVLNLAKELSAMKSELEFPYFYTRRTQQDQLEHLFENIRVRGGLSSNPTVVELQYRRRKILALEDEVFDPPEGGNCSRMPEMPTREEEELTLEIEIGVD